MPNAAETNQMGADSEFWDFIVCTACYLPYTADATLTMPFWLTECGHVVCNNHLKSDQSCACCGSANIQVVPLQRQMEEPMSHWFGSIPAALDTIAFASKFQHEMMANQIRHYRSRHVQYRGYIERLKRDVAELKRMNESLSNENEGLRQSLDGKARYTSNDVPADFANSNGKRPMVASNQYFQAANSSPRSIPTPIAPQRLTLRPGQQLPEFPPTRHANSNQTRPVSNRVAIQQYAYAPPDTSQFAAPQLSRGQAASRQFRQPQADNNSDPGPSNGNQWEASNQTEASTSMRPPQGFQQPGLPKSRFKPVIGDGNNRTAGPSTTNRNPQKRAAGTMGPPPTPQLGGSGFPNLTRRLVPPTPVNEGNQQQKRFFQPGRNQNRSALQQQQQPPATLRDTQSGTRNGMGGVITMNAAGTSGQRMPFLPGGNTPMTSMQKYQ